MIAFYYWTLLIVRDVYLKAAGSKISHVDAEGIVASPSNAMGGLAPRIRTGFRLEKLIN
jgi:hypothetical protein